MTWYLASFRVRFFHLSAGTFALAECDGHERNERDAMPWPEWWIQ
jgi:hypothetical protein